MNTRPLCVDLDGTLVRSDLLSESIIILLKTRPLTFFLIPFWLLAGRSVVKQKIAERVDLDVRSLPYQNEFVEFLKSEHASGRPIILGRDHIKNMLQKWQGISTSLAVCMP